MAKAATKATKTTAKKASAKKAAAAKSAAPRAAAKAAKKPAKAFAEKANPILTLRNIAERLSATHEVPKDGERQTITVLVTDEDGHPVYSAALCFVGTWLLR